MTRMRLAPKSIRLSWVKFSNPSMTLSLLLAKSTIHKIQQNMFEANKIKFGEVCTVRMYVRILDKNMMSYIILGD